MFFIQILSLKRINIPKFKTLTTNNVVVVNTYDFGGGAAKIARQLAYFLNDTHSIRFYVKTKKTNEEWIHKIQSKQYTFLEEVLRRESEKKGWIEFTGFHALGLMNDPFFVSSSIIHLHNLHGEFFSPVLFKSLFQGKKVIWTLHDESFITGHCSCTLGCDQWQKGCGSCPDLTIYPPVNFDNTKEVLLYKKKWITQLKPIIVCPSHWLADRVRLAYPELKNIEVIPNGIDIDVFHPRDKVKIRKNLDFPVDKQIVLFVAEFSTQNPFKGGSILREIITDTSFSDVFFVTVGGSQKIDMINHISYPYISNETELSILYAACDVLLYPTQADNLPLVVLESMACGTLVIASSLGGVSEIISDSVDGFLVENFKSEISFKQKLFHVLEMSEKDRCFMGIKARNKIVEHFSLSKMLNRYKRIYSFANLNINYEVK